MGLEREVCLGWIWVGRERVRGERRVRGGR